MCGHGGDITAMTLLVAGLVLFLGAHSVRIVADAWRTSLIARIGRNPWRGLYSLVSLVGFVLIVWGYGQARARSRRRLVAAGVDALRHVAARAARVRPDRRPATCRGTRIRAALGHPMVLGTKLWAFAHLL